MHPRIIFTAITTMLCLQANCQQVVFTIQGDRPENVSVTFFRDHVFDRSKLRTTYKVLHVSEHPITIPYSNVTRLARLTLYSPGWPGRFIATNWIVEPGDSISITIQFEQTTPVIKFSGRGARKYQLALAISHLRKALSEVEYQVYDNSKTHDQAMQEVATLERQYKDEVTAKRSELSKAVYVTWITDISASANLARVHIRSHQWAHHPAQRQQIAAEVLKPMQYEPEQLYLSRPLVTYLSQRIKWMLLMQRDPNYKYYELLGSIHQYSIKDLFIELNKLPQPERQVLMVFNLNNTADLYLTFGETHPDLINECLQMAELAVTTPHLKFLLDHANKKIKPGISIDDLITIKENGDTLKLSDLRGKKVLLDLWAPRCTGCLSFRNDLVTEILPKVLNRDDVVILSIGSTWDLPTWKQYQQAYSHHDFNESWLPRMEDGTPWERQYTFGASPFVMLIDEYGKLISSTVRKPDTILSLLEINE